jgi:hypothetical protein
MTAIIKRGLFYPLFVAVLGIAIFAGCSGPTGVDTVAPTVVSTDPLQGAINVGQADLIKATFSEEMEPATVDGTSFSLENGGVVSGTVTYDVPSKTATFAPDSLLSTATVYTATISTDATDTSANGLADTKIWSFTTIAAAGLGPAPVLLGTAGNYVILAKSAISTVPASTITGEIGLSPAAESFITGFSQTDQGTYATSPQVTGRLYAADMAAPTPTVLTTATSDMITAYNDAAGRSTPDFTDLNAGAIGGETLAPGLYKWASTVSAATDVTISGAPNDVWIFQMTGDLTVSNGVQFTLTGGAQAKNIFWQVAGAASLGTSSHFEGVILSQTAVTLNTGASMNGRVLAQTAVDLDQATITKPAS